MEKLVKTVKVNEFVKYEIYNYGKYYIVVDYLNNMINGESFPLIKQEIEEYLKYFDLA